MTDRAIIYTRVSTEEQAEHGYGLEVQLELARNYARLYQYDVIAEYSDPGISGTKDADERPGLQATLQAARAKEFRILILPSLDRLARRGALGLKLYDEFEREGVAIAAVKERLDTTTPTGRLMRTFFLGLAEFERDLIVERTTAGRNARGRRDGDRGGRMPMGYVRDNGIGVDPERASMVKAIFALFDKGLSMQAIARYLNAIEYTTPRGKRWHASSVREIIIRRLVYQGANRGESPVTWPKIL
jgi:site-specific DNA recombinase